MSSPLRRTLGVLACMAMGLGVSAWDSAALAHEVPNEALAFWPRLFAQEGLAYGTAEAPFVRCPNATDKVLLPNGVNGAVDGAGVCVSDVFVVHLLSGVETPNGWSTLTFPNGTFLSYRLTSRG
jgi:hypothetical protein